MQMPIPPELMYLPNDRDPERYINAIEIECTTQAECDYIDAHNAIAESSTPPNGGKLPRFRPSKAPDLTSIINSKNAIHRSTPPACCCNNPTLNIKPSDLSNGHLYTKDLQCLNNLPKLQQLLTLEPTYVPQIPRTPYTRTAHPRKLISNAIHNWHQNTSPPHTDVDLFRHWYRKIILPQVNKSVPKPRPIPQLSSISDAKAELASIPGLCVGLIDKIKRFGLACEEHFQQLATQLTDDPTMFEPTALTDHQVVTMLRTELTLVHGGPPPYEIYIDQPNLASTIKLKKGTARPVIDCHQKGAVMAALTLWSILCLIIQTIQSTDPENWTAIDSIYDISKVISVNDDIFDGDGEGYFTGPPHTALISHAFHAFQYAARKHAATHISVRFTSRRPKARWCTANYKCNNVHHLDQSAIHMLITTIVTKMYVRIGTELKRQLTGGPMGLPCSGELCALNLYMCRRNELSALRTDYPQLKICTSTDDELVANLPVDIYQTRLGPAMRAAGINVITENMTPAGLPYLHLTFYRDSNNRLRHRPYSKRVTLYPGTPELATPTTRRSQRSLTYTLYGSFILAYRASSTHADFTTRIAQFARNIAHQPYYTIDTYIFLYRRLIKHLDGNNRFGINDRQHAERRYSATIKTAYRNAS